MKRGEIWWASRPAPSGSGPGKRRAVVVVESNPFNRSRIATVAVAVATVRSYLALHEAPGNVRVGMFEPGLTKPSVVIMSQILTLDRELLTQRVRGLPADTMRKVDEGLRLVLGI